MRLKILPLFAFVLVFATMSLAVETLDSLKRAFTDESQTLDRAIGEYGRERSQERNAIGELRRLSQQLEEAIDNPHSSLNYLTQLEDELKVARDRACYQAETTALARQEMYVHMQTLGEISRQFEREAGILVADQTDLNGMWQVEAQPNDVVGLLNLRVKGTQVSGPYKLNNGNQGTVRGSISGDRLDLDMVDSQKGMVGSIEGRVDRATGRIEGIWQALELGGSGRPAFGEWFATRLSGDEHLDLGF